MTSSGKVVDEPTRQLNDAHEREAATREILRVINRSPGDYQPVFEAILESAARLCDTALGFLLIREEDGFHFVANRGGAPKIIDYLRANPLPLDPQQTVTAQSALERRPIQVADITDHPSSNTGQEHRRNAAAVPGVSTRLTVPMMRDEMGVRTQLTVPMLRGEECIGVILVFRQEVREFEARHVELLSTFADQAVIAIENVRLFQALQTRTTDLTKSLERQTATSEILRSISRSPTDYQPVFETILENATRLCDAPLGQLYLIRDGGVHLVANRGSRPEFLEFSRDNIRPANRKSGSIAKALLERRPVYSEDPTKEALYRDGDKFPRGDGGVGRHPIPYDRAIAQRRGRYWRHDPLSPRGPAV